jgi:hypothetical protein
VRHIGSKVGKKRLEKERKIQFLEIIVEEINMLHYKKEG